MSNLLKIASVLLSILTINTAKTHESGIRQIDFRNFSYPWDNTVATVPLNWRWITTSSHGKIRLIDGRHDFFNPRASEIERKLSPSLEFHFVTYGDLDGDQIEEAAIALNYSTGGTANWDYLYVYKFEHGAAKLVGRLESGSRADGGLIQVSIRNGLLIVDFADSERRVADCCSEGFIRVHYRWRNGRFIEEGPRERGDLKSNVRPLADL